MAAHGVAGLLLAAGAGRRYGMPKALAGDPRNPWVVSTCERMREAGCDPLLVVVGAAADDVAALLPRGVTAVLNAEWAAGMGSSLRVGLEAAAELESDVIAALVMLVDLPGVTTEALSTILELAGEQVLARADYNGTPGHPVLLGRAHWAPVKQSAAADVGARDYLLRHGAVQVALAGRANGADIDWPD